MNETFERVRALMVSGAAAVTYWVAVHSANNAYDRSLLDPALDISENLRFDSAGAEVDLPPKALEALVYDQVDRVVFQVRSPDNAIVAGDRDLPPPPELGPGQQSFFTTSSSGEEMRVAAHRTANGYVVQVGETLHKRNRLVGEIVAAELIPTLLVAGAAITLALLGISQGLHPLEELRSELIRRGPRDLHPLGSAAAPIEVAPLVGAFNRLLGEVRDASTMQQRFLANAAHQLRTPLAGLQMHLELLLRRDVSRDVRPELERMTGLVAPPSRNAPCPCGSGRRYKECHGALVAASSADTVRVLLVTALAAQQDGRLAEAEEYYTRALALDPTNFDALHMLGVTYFQRQEFTRSRELIRAACVLRPDVVEAARNLELVEAALARVDAQARYRSWIATIEKASVAARARLRNAIAGRADAPRLSLVMPAYNSSPRWLAACLDSVFAQTYPHWELCIADDASTDPATRDTLANYAARDSRIRIVWRAVNGHISAASNSALTLATAPYIALLDHDDALPDHALAEVALALVDHPTTSILYTDEDKLDEQGVRFEPYFKPDWNPALASSQNFVSHLGVYRTELVR